MATEQLTPLSYYSAPQASIYINGILLDESKEPIYGYLDKFFAALIGGTVIITGSFTINYKHDQYLTQVLKKAAKPTEYTSDFLQESRVTSGSKRARTLREFDKLYKEKLADYADSLKTKKDKTVTATKLTKEIADKEAKLDRAKEELKNDVKNSQTILAQAQQSKTAFLDGFEPPRQEELKSGLEEYKAKLGVDQNNEPLGVNARFDSVLSLETNAYNINRQMSDQIDIIRQAKEERQSEVNSVFAVKNLAERKYDKLINSPDPDYQAVEDAVREMNMAQAALNNSPEDIGLQGQVTALEVALEDEKQNQINTFTADIALVNEKKAEAQAMLDNDADLKRLKELDDAVVKADQDLSDFMQLDPDDPEIPKLIAKKAQLEAEIAQLMPEIKRNELIKINADINALTVTASDLKGDAESDAGWSRAEDNDLPFTIEFNYNGTPHKRLVHCSLLGHGHQIGMSGQPVKEYYQFISRKFEYQ
jgi:hypothetical protein